MPNTAGASTTTTATPEASTTGGRCGPRGATHETTNTTGPNGSIDWLNCGIDTDGWDPPYISIDRTVVVDLSDALQSSNSVFTACSHFVGLFQTYGETYNIPAIMLASFAMQDNDKCAGAPGGNCRDPDFNIRTAAAYFSNTLDGNQGDVLLSVGTYNGWYKGLTEAEATAASNSSCCQCQNNLDYLFQFMNGWMQNIYASGLGKYHNLDVCGS
ncbi:glycoside hydrolase family 23 protein [Mycena olivaceomarginata]|nr:glycoside hydrolase family 23 protein [Mycena olivaceomarginata]